MTPSPNPRTLDAELDDFDSEIAFDDLPASFFNDLDVQIEAAHRQRPYSQSPHPYPQRQLSSHSSVRPAGPLRVEIQLESEDRRTSGTRDALGKEGSCSGSLDSSLGEDELQDVHRNSFMAVDGTEEVEDMPEYPSLFALYRE